MSDMRYFYREKLRMQSYDMPMQTLILFRLSLKLEHQSLLMSRKPRWRLSECYQFTMPDMSGDFNGNRISFLALVHCSCFVGQHSFLFCGRNCRWIYWLNVFYIIDSLILQDFYYFSVTNNSRWCWDRNLNLGTIFDFQVSETRDWSLSKDYKKLMEQELISQACLHLNNIIIETNLIFF